MFESALVDLLRADTELATYVTTRNSKPSIFADEAPEGVEMPYIVCKINMSGTAGNIVMSSDVYIDYYDYDLSRAKADSAGRRIELLLDKKKIDSERLGDIRFSLGSCGFVDESDPRSIHYNLLFDTRGARKDWMQSR
jgi:hypothetical protein